MQFKCAECGATFENKTYLKNHARNHGRFPCPEVDCEHVATRKDHLNLHILRKHAGSEYAAAAQPRKRKSNKASKKGAKPSKLRKVEPAEVELPDDDDQQIKENIRLDDDVPSAEGEGVQPLVEEVEDLGNEINVMGDRGNRLNSELSSVGLPSDDL